MKPILLVLLGAVMAKALVDDPEPLAPLYGQCGGFAYIKYGIGPTKCVAGAYCHEINGYYAWCLPIPTPDPTAAPTAVLN